MKRALIGFGLAGMLLFGVLWLLSLTQPRLVETALQQAIRIEVEHKTGMRVDTVLNAPLVRGALSAWHGKLPGPIKAAYAEVTAKLLREFRIFTVTNALAFALLAAVASLRGQAGLQLLLPAVVLTGAVLFTAGVYLLGQDWLHTIIFNQYTGWAYAGYLAAVALLLGDILLNRAQVTTRMANIVLHVVDAGVTAVTY